MFEEVSLLLNNKINPNKRENFDFGRSDDNGFR